MEFEGFGRGDSEMTKAAKLTYTIAAISGLVLGSLIGFEKTGTRLAAASGARRSIAERELESFSGIQYRHADHDHAKAGLEMYKDFLEQIERADPESSLKLKLSVTYTRLALLEETAHSMDRSRAYMNEAKSWCEADGGQDCSEGELKKMAEQFDIRQAIYEP
jgi:hypothetical protein